MDALAFAAPAAAAPTVARSAAGDAVRDNAPRLGDVLAALSHALDLTEGQPAGHSMRCCWIAQQLGRALGLPIAQLRDLYYATLLKDAGCSSNAARVCALFLADDRRFKHDLKRAGANLPGLARFLLTHTGTASGVGFGRRVRAVLHALQDGTEMKRELVETRCQRGADIARRLRFGEPVAEAIAALDEHWDGSGHPESLSGDAIPLAARVMLLAQVVDVHHTAHGPLAAREEVARRAGRWIDPALADVFAVLARDDAFWAPLADPALEERTLALEPARQPQPLDEDWLDDIAAAFGQVVDAKSPWTGGHSGRVAGIAENLGRQLGLDAARRRWLHRGALLHDVGKLGVSNLILDKPGPLDPWEWAEMQRHASHTERILGRIPAFGALARVAGAHHERLDGGGYPRGLDARHIRLETRLITTADIFDALTADRPYRAAMPVPQAFALMAGMVGSQVDADCFAALRAGFGAG